MDALSGATGGTGGEIAAAGPLAGSTGGFDAGNFSADATLAGTPDVAATAGGPVDLSGLALGGAAGAAGGQSVLGSALNLFGQGGGSSGGNVPTPGVSPVSPTPAIQPIQGASTPAIGGPSSVAASIPNASGTLDPTQADLTGTNLGDKYASVPGIDGVGATTPGVGAGAAKVAGVDSPKTTAAAGAPQSGWNSFLKSILSPGGKEAISAGALGLDLLRGSQDPAGVKALKGLAASDQAQASNNQALATAEGEGLLPAGAQSLVQNNLNAQIAAIKTNYAKMGMSGSSAEIQDINAAKSEALAQTFQIGNTLAQQGLQQVTEESGQQSQLLQAILTAETAQGTQLGDALAGFAGAAAK